MNRKIALCALTAAMALSALYATTSKRKTNPKSAVSTSIGDTPRNHAALEEDEPSNASLATPVVPESLRQDVIPEAKERGEPKDIHETIDFDKKYRKTTLEELIHAKATIQRDLDALQQPEFRRRFDAGFGEYLGEGTTLNVTDHDPLEVSSYQFLPNGRGIYKVVLPKEEFPELYALQAELVWLRDTIDERQDVAATGR